MDHEPRSRAFEALAQLLVSEGSLGDSLRAVANVAQDAVPAARYAGLSMADESNLPVTPVYTDPDVPDMDRAQYESGRGPCLAAWRYAEVVRIDDMASDAGSEYPEFAEAALAHGVRSTISIPLVAEGTSLGALNLYSPQVNGFSQEDEQLLLDLAPATAAFMANARAYWGAYALSEQLNAAMSSRAVIEQAKGVLMASTPGIDAGTAFDMLKTASQRENVKLRDIAQRIVDQRISGYGQPPIDPTP